MTGVSLAPIGVLLLVACLIAMLSRRLGLPYIVGLVVAGFLIALLPNGPQLALSRELIFNILLPPLVFEAALQLDWQRFKGELPLTVTLAVVGVGVAAAVVAGGMLIGVGVSAAILLIVGRTDDPLVEITLTTITAYASFLVAEHFHASGIMGALTAGLIVGNIGWATAISESGRDRILYAWQYFAFLANSFVFILIGMNAENQPLRELGSFAAALAIVLVLLGRALSIYPLALLFHASRWRVPASYQHVLFWGGLRGALALALALAVPVTVPERGAIIITAFVVVAFSILVQGLTMPWLIRRFDLGNQPQEEPVAGPAAAD